jgi:hypothetical protein
VGRSAGHLLPSTSMSAQKRFVYALRSEVDQRPYVGITSNVPQRLATHNSGVSVYTAPYGPWRLEVSIEFRNGAIRRRFGAGSEVRIRPAFARRHFM